YSVGCFAVVSAGAASAGDRVAGAAYLAGPGPLSPDPLRTGWPALHRVEVSFHGAECRTVARRRGAPQRGRWPGVQDSRRSPGHTHCPLAAPHQSRRAAAALEHPSRRHVIRRPAATHTGRSGKIRVMAAPPIAHASGTDLFVG